MTISKKNSFTLLIITIILGVWYILSPEVKIENNMPTHYIWNKDSKQIYNLKINTKFFKNQEQSFELDIDAILNFRVYEVQGDTIKVGFELSDIVYMQNKHNDKEYAKILSTLVLAEMQKDGTFHEFYFSNQLSIDDEIIIKNIILNFSTTLNEKKDYTVIESDSIGEYEAKYSINKDKILREKLKYHLKDDIDSSFGTIVKLKDSKAYLKLSKNQSWLSSFNMDESGMISGKIINNEFVNHSSLKQIEYTLDKSLLIWKDYSFSELLKLFKQNRKNQISYHQKLDDKIAKREFILNKTTFKNVLDNLIQSIKNKKDIVSSQEELVKYMRLFPQSILELQNMLENRELNDKESSTLITLLAICGTKEAQIGLLNILNNSVYVHFDSVRAAMALSRLKVPEDEIVDSLINIYADMPKDNSDDLEKAGTAILALGVLSRNINGELKTKLYDSLSDSLSESRDGKDAIIYAMGNTQEVSFVEDIEKYTDDEEITIRMAVYKTLGNLKSEKSENLLINSLEKEKSIVVKEIILSSLLKYEQTDNIFDAINSAVIKEGGQSSKTLMVKYLSQDRENRAKTVETFKTLLKQENSKESLKIILNTLKENKQ